jgi:phosphopantetheine adenylyltransferase
MQLMIYIYIYIAHNEIKQLIVDLKKDLQLVENFEKEVKRVDASICSYINLVADLDSHPMNEN